MLNTSYNENVNSPVSCDIVQNRALGTVEHCIHCNSSVFPCEPSFRLDRLTHSNDDIFALALVFCRLGAESLESAFQSASLGSLLEETDDRDVWRWMDHDCPPIAVQWALSWNPRAISSNLCSVFWTGRSCSAQSDSGCGEKTSYTRFCVFFARTDSSSAFGRPGRLHPSSHCTRILRHNSLTSPNISPVSK